MEGILDAHEEYPKPDTKKKTVVAIRICLRDVGFLDCNDIADKTSKSKEKAI
jgi:hypothetical protein